ncbi:MAG: hypothetical protein PHQ65_09565 [Bacteroidales bacterium]|nr:hypothetical protein [Bacteroidales bacterium]MDD3665497.1 hypothetical protein [Bacteroidales bacterium]
MKKLLTTVLVLFLAHQSFAQLTYFNRTGEGYAIGGAFSGTKINGFVSDSYSVVASERVSRMASVGIQFTSSSVQYGYSRSSASAFIPTISLQAPNDSLLGIAAHLGYVNSRLTNDIPTFLIGLEVYKRFNSSGTTQIIPTAGFNQSILLKKNYSDPKPVFNFGINVAFKFSRRGFLVLGPGLSLSGDQTILGFQGGFVWE